MTDEEERIQKKEIVAYLRYHPDILLEGVKRTIKNMPRQQFFRPRFEPGASFIQV
jgi:hypothetical protein